MSITTTWTSTRLPPGRAPEQREHRGPHPAWDCANCSLLNAGARKRCSDCGTSRD